MFGFGRVTGRPYVFTKLLFVMLTKNTVRLLQVYWQCLNNWTWCRFYIRWWYSTLEKSPPSNFRLTTMINENLKYSAIMFCKTSLQSLIFRKRTMMASASEPSTKVPQQERREEQGGKSTVIKADDDTNAPVKVEEQTEEVLDVE